MKFIAMLFSISIIITSCANNVQEKIDIQPGLPIQGTWQLISGTTIEKNDTTVTDYTKDKSFIKIIGDSHFAFLGHDLDKGKDTTKAFFTSGGGKYDLKDSAYTEHLEYCNAREWEGNDFSFTVKLVNDTLIQSGIEKVDSINVNRLNIEKYVRIKK